MMRIEKFPVAQIYVPVKRRATLVQARVDELAASMLKDGQQVPIKVRGEDRRPEPGGPRSIDSDAR